MNSRISGAASSDLLSRIRHADLRRFSVTALCAGLFVVALVYGYRLERTGAHKGARQQTLTDLRVLDVALRDAQRAPESGPYPEVALASIRTSTDRAHETLHDWDGSPGRWGWLAARIAPVTPSDVRADEEIIKQVQMHLQETERAVHWWHAFQPAIADIVAYDAAVDLRGISASEDRQELLRRMYLAKGGLDRARTRMQESLEFAREPKGLRDIIARTDSLAALVVQLITAADRRLWEQSNTLQVDYIYSMRLLQESVRAYARAAYQDDPLAGRARASSALLTQLGELDR